MAVEISVYVDPARDSGEVPEGAPVTVQRLLDVGDTITVTQVGPDGTALVRINPLGDEAVTLAFAGALTETFEGLEYRRLPINGTLTLADPWDSTPILQTQARFDRDEAYDRHLTGVPAVFDRGVVVSEWYADDVPTGLDLTINGNDFAGKMLKYISICTSGSHELVSESEGELIPGQGTCIIDDDFNGAPNGTLVSDDNSDKGAWVGEGGPTTMVLIADTYATPPSGVTANSLAEIDVGETDVMADFGYGDLQGSGGSLIMLLCYDRAEKNAVRVAVTLNNAQNRVEVSFFTYKKGAQIGVNKYTFLHIPQPGDILRLKLQNSQLTVYKKYVTTDGDTSYRRMNIGNYQASGYSNEGAGVIDISASPWDYARGTWFYWTVSGTTANTHRMDRVTVWALSGSGFNIASVEDGETVVGLPTRSQGHTLKINGVYDGSAPTSLDVEVTQSTTVVLDRRPASITQAEDGTWSATVQSLDLLGLDATKDHAVRIWKDGAGNPATLSFRPTIYAELQPHHPAQQKNSETYWEGTDSYRDLGPKLFWLTFYPGSNQDTPLHPADQSADPVAEGAVGLDGVVHTYPGGGTTSSRLRAILPYSRGAGRYGTGVKWVVKGWPAGMTAGIGGNANDYTIVPGAPAGEIWFNFPRAENTDTGNKIVYLEFAGNLPAEGFDTRAISVAPEGSGTDFCTPVEHQMKAGIKGMRFMQADDINSVNVIPGGRVDPWFGTNQNGFGLDTKIEHCNALGCDLWFNIPRDAKNEWITTAATFIRDNLNSGLKVWPQYANETWNVAGGGFVRTNWYTAIRGIERGLVAPSATTFADAEPLGFNITIPEVDVWVVPYRISDLRIIANPLAAYNIFPINFDLPEFEDFRSLNGGTLTGVHFVQNMTVLRSADGSNNPSYLTPGMLRYVRPATGEDLAKWCPFDNYLRAWQSIESDYHFHSAGAADVWGMGDYKIIVTEKDISAGDTLSLDNCGVYLIPSYIVASDRYTTVREAEIHDIFTDVFGGHERLNRVKGWWWAAASSIINPNSLANVLAWYGDTSKFDYYACAPYWGNDPLGYLYMGITTPYDRPGGWALDSGKQFYPGWGLTTKALVDSDQAAWLNFSIYGNTAGTGSNLDGPWPLSMKATVYAIGSAAHRNERAFRSIVPGYVPNSIKFCSYECGMGTGMMLDHDSGYAEENSASDNATAAYEALLNHPAMRDWTYGYYAGIRDVLGGAHFQFVDLRGSVTEVGTQYLRYGLGNNVHDTGSPALLGWLEAAALPE
ncbi:hypothetical protein [Sphingomonas quercus]|uniref:Uncharacterized protein n=1 Tax=Sphingomonas quercus TaxID=2842451 RepID=A0ABS6BG89_9SPHN|nr:hypothetical protein [Sphingomonas quercus]MBU3077310.1 hypothetical protein [Sphingomonas quercus]